MERQNLGSTATATGSLRHLILPQRKGHVATLRPQADPAALPLILLQHPENFWGLIKTGMPGRDMPEEVRRWRAANAPRLIWGARRVMAAKVLGLPYISAALSLVVIRGNGRVLDYGLASFRVVTTAGVNFIVDAFQNLVEVELMKFHGYGTGGGAEAVGDTALTTELTTQYATDNVRPTGSQTETSANIYSTVATLSPDATVTITEHGIFSATSAGTLLDRSLFTGVPLTGSADSMQSTYNLTLSAGG